MSWFDDEGNGGRFRLARRNDLESPGMPFMADLHVSVPDGDGGRRAFDLSGLSKCDLLAMRREINRVLKGGE